MPAGVKGAWLGEPRQGQLICSLHGARGRRGGRPGQRDSPAHALQGLGEHLRGHAVLVLQDQALLQRHRHGRAVLGALAAGEPDPIKAAADLPTGTQAVLRGRLHKMETCFVCNTGSRWPMAAGRCATSQSQPSLRFCSNSESCQSQQRK